jgi:hypothetical protein
MTRLEAVIQVRPLCSPHLAIRISNDGCCQVLRFHGKPMYYDVLTRLALK